MAFPVAVEALQLFADTLALSSTVTETEREALLALPATPRRVQAHREILRTGESADQAYLIADGFVARFAQLADGARQTVSLHIVGDLLDMASLVLPAAAIPITALTTSTVLQIPRDALRQLASDHRGIAAAFWRGCAVEGSITTQWLVGIGRRDARARLAHLLCEMGVRWQRTGRYDCHRFPFPMTQEQIADALALTAVHVNRTLQTLRREGLIQVANREVIILDWGALADAASFDGAYLHLPIPAVDPRARSA